MLIRDEEAREGVHRDPALVVRVPERFCKDLGRDCEHRHVLNVRVVLKSIAHNVMRVVVALPPAEREPHERSEGGAHSVVHVEVVRHTGVAKVVPQPRELLPKDAHRGGTGKMFGGTLAREGEVERAEEEQREPRAEHCVVPVVRLEEPPPEELLAHSTEVGDVRPHDDVGDVANEVARKHVLVHLDRVVVCEDVGAVLTRHRNERPHPARVALHERRDVVGLFVHHDPEVVPRAVLGDVREGVPRQRGGAFRRSLAPARKPNRRHQHALALLFMPAYRRIRVRRAHRSVPPDSATKEEQRHERRSGRCDEVAKQAAGEGRRQNGRAERAQRRTHRCVQPVATHAPGEQQGPVAEPPGVA